MYVMAGTFAGLRDGIIGCTRGREFARNQLRNTGTVTIPIFLGEQHDFRVQDARRLLTEDCADVYELRTYLRLLIQLADDWADTDVDEEKTYTLIWGGLHIRAQDLPILCETCSARLTEIELRGRHDNSA
jgi:hypothetical protein